MYMYTGTCIHGYMDIGIDVDIDVYIYIYTHICDSASLIEP